MEPMDTCGLFGKLPMQSDFINHFLPESFTDGWHGWLQACMQISQEQLGNDWREYYLSAPVWRFSLMPGIAHTQGVVGILIPSVDEVGRYFPLTLAHLGPHKPWVAYLNGRSWFDKAEYTALLALEDDLSYSSYLSYYERMRPPELPQWPDLAELPRHNNQHSVMMDWLNFENPEQSALQLLDRNYQQLYGQYSLWWTEGSDLVEPCLLSCQRLPDSGQFAALLDGQWQERNWTVAAPTNANQPQQQTSLAG